ncbi:MAG: phosphate ABC transporter substrate-binding protein [Moraxellaceae bacterium]|nr:MAG: phosphate ABC transporter substrate-binding protein [Moraxellaceae bacterium]
MKNSTKTGILGLTFALLSFSASAEVKVIGNSSIADSALSKDIAAKIFLGKLSKSPSGAKLVAIDQEPGEAAREEFYSKIANKNESQLKAYWSRLIFTGKGMPPKRVLDDEEVVELVAANPESIGYVSGDADIAGTKVLLTMP